MFVTIYSPKNKLFDNVKAKSVYLPGADGDLQVLDNHIPILVTLREGTIVVEEVNGSKQSIEVDNGYAQFSENKMNIVVVDTKLNTEELEAIEQKAVDSKDASVRMDKDISETEFFEAEQSERNVGRA